MSLTPDDIRAIMAAFDASDWSDLSLQHDGTHLELSRSGGTSFVPESVHPSDAPTVAAASSPAAEPVTPAPVPATAPDSPASAPDGVRVLAPTVGLFWASPQPGAPPFVEVGQSVRPDDTVCIVEVMKLMSHVKAGVAGVVVAKPVENGAMVEHGDTLVIIAED
ncbi:acetyl-CoA carboxylase biotin carboxyl carrier protein [Aeromicrobium wangtongii]|uniref:acetyl-CoA carboxylase biotin carboxyl carrier protein n=1 Tax=Aeromicrobium wangtongii TaxID=2969247 RepID=UPI002017634F|nr:biotin/lipoyl-containing protein [Aeromicrobium wangtongii]MCL3818617.1 hypothetical protein [Aeromicrobium wangtongii]